MMDHLPRSFEEVLEELDHVTWRLSHAGDEEEGAIDQLIDWQEALIREMNNHPDNPTP